MSFIIRPSRLDDLEAIYEMAKLTGSGFTNLPPDRRTLQKKLERSAAAFSCEEDGLADDLFMLMLENGKTGQVRGTCQIMTRVGSEWPFYSYRLTSFTQHSRELDRSLTAEMLTLVTDLEGSTEVGGLFLHPGERAGGLGLLLARSRYLFMRRHRERIADLTIAELRGVIDEAGSSPFWDALAGRFFDMSFQEADEFNAIHGNQFIADLMPKSPVYLALLPDSARGVIGRCHPTGKAALRMLRQEGFEYEDYIDIFDGGPTVIARTDRIRTIEMARGSRIAAIEGGGEKAIVAHGRLNGFRAGYARLAPRADGETAIDGEAAEALGLGVGDEILHVPRSLG